MVHGFYKSSRLLNYVKDLLLGFMGHEVRHMTFEIPQLK